MVRKRLPKTLRPNDVETLVLSSPLLTPLFSCFIFTCSGILEARLSGSPISWCLWLLYRTLQIDLTLYRLLLWRLAFTAVGISSSFYHWFHTYLDTYSIYTRCSYSSVFIRTQNISDVLNPGLNAEAGDTLPNKSTTTRRLESFGIGVLDKYDYTLRSSRGRN